MKKKLLSLLLVLCMVLPMVPLGMITAVAEEEDTDSYATKLETNGENWPKISRNNAVDLYQPGAWTMVSDFTGGWGFAGYIDGVVTPQTYFSDWFATYGGWQDGQLALYNPDEDCLYGGVTRTDFGENFQNNGAGFTYQVPSTGTLTADVSFNVGGCNGWEISFVGGVLYYSIVKVDSNGDTTVVYPAEGAEGAADVATEGAGMKYTEGAQQEEATFSVTAGDTLMFVFRAKTYVDTWWNYDFVNNFSATLSYDDPNLNHNPNSNPNPNPDPDPDPEPEPNPDPNFASELVTNGTNWPKITRNESVALQQPGAWTLVRGFTGGWGFAGYNNGIISPQTFDNAYATYGNWMPGRLCLYNPDTASLYSGVLRTGFGENFQNYGAGFTYEVTSTGKMTADVSFNVAWVGTVGPVYYSIVRISHGVATVVYPAEGANGAADVETEGAGMKYTTDGYKQEKATFAVTEGDTLMFLFRTKTYVGDWWSYDCATDFRASLSYDEFGSTTDSDEVTVSAKVDVGASFAVKFIVSGGTNAGVEILSGKTDKILAKEMADEITYRTYQVIDGERVYGETLTTSLAEILAHYATKPSGVTRAEADMAAALYHYGYAAANYFVGDTLPDETKTLLGNVTFDFDKTIHTAPLGTTPSYKLVGATLVLEDVMKLAFLVQTADGSTMSSAGLSMLVADEHGHQKALVDADAFYWPKGGENSSQMLVNFAVPVSQYPEMQYVTVLVNGEKASDTVAYGVPTYVARQYKGGQGNADYVLRAIANITNIASTAPAFDGLVKATDTATFKYCGTWEPQGDIMVSYWNESYVEVDFYGTSVTPVFEYTGAFSRFSYSIDGGDYVSNCYITGGDFPISGLKEGKHTLRIKTNDRYDNVFFAGVKVGVDGCPYELQKTETKAHYIQFVGDSISDAPNSFARRVGTLLGWDYATTAIAGLSLETGYGFWNTKDNAYDAAIGTKIGMEDAFFKYGIPQQGMTDIMKERYKNYYTDPSLNNTYATGYDPDIVFIFLGTNDSLDGLDGNGNPTAEERFTASYLNFVKNIKAVYGDDTEIWVMQALSSSPASGGQNNLDAGRFDCIIAAYEALKAEYGDTIHFIDCVEILNDAGMTVEEIIDFNGDTTHPTPFGYDKLTEVIADALDAHYN